MFLRQVDLGPGPEADKAVLAGAAQQTEVGGSPCVTLRVHCLVLSGPGLLEFGFIQC